MNFVPKMDKNLLVKGYESIVSTIYSPNHYYERVKNFLKAYTPGESVKKEISAVNIMAFLKSVFRLGIIGKERRYYWQLLTWSIFKRPEVFRPPSGFPYMDFISGRSMRASANFIQP